MFKKPVQVQQQTMLTGKERKALQAALKQGLNGEAIDAYFKDNELIQIEKLKGSKAVIYTSDYPAFVDANGKGLFFPSIYVVSEYPVIVGEIKIKEGIESLVLKGGNLMWDGVVSIPDLGDFKKDDVRAIVSNDGKIIAIGAMGSDSDAINYNEPATYTLLTISDTLWEYGPKTYIPAKEKFKRKPKSTKPELRFEEKKLPVPESDSDDDEPQQDLSKLVGGLKSKVQVKKATKKPVQSQPIKDLEDSDDDHKNKKKKKAGQKGQDHDDGEKLDQTKGKKKEEVEEERKEGPAIPIKVMDEYIREAFLNAIKVGVSDKNLPLDAQTFYQNYMLAYKKENIELDIKNSSFQKIGKFLTQMAKEELIDYKEGKKGQQPQIFSIDRSHEKYESWEPTVLKAYKKDETEEGNLKNLEFKANIELLELYKPSALLTPIFKSALEARQEEQGKEKKKDKEDKDKKEKKEKKEDKEQKDEKKDKQDKEELYLTRDEVKKILLEYVATNCEIDKKKKNIIKLTDSILIQLVPAEEEEEEEESEQQQQQQNSKKDKEEDEEGKKKKRVGKKVERDIITQEQLLVKVYDNLQKFHKVTNLNTKQSEIRPGEFKGINITAEKQHNKNVTTIQGLEAFGWDAKLKPDNPNSLLRLEKVFAEKFSCEVSMHDLPGKNAGKEIILQGLFPDQLIDYFTNVCKIDQQYVHEINKIVAKKKPQTFK